MAKSPSSITETVIKILLIEAEDCEVANIRGMFPERRGLKYELMSVASAADANSMLASQAFDVVLFDLGTPSPASIQSLIDLRALFPDKPVVVIVAPGNDDLGVEAVRKGAQDYLIKGEEDARTVARIVRYAIERCQAEAQLRISLQEKETLLREVHHRVKNNLQLILSLLRLGAENVPESEAKQIFEDSHNRIRAMSMIHENLYLSQDVSKIPFHDYARGLMKELFSAHNAWARGIEMDLQVASIELGVDTAIPCGLILHELVTNALEHAFPEGKELRRGDSEKACDSRKKVVQVVFCHMEGEMLRLQVCDSGIGVQAQSSLQSRKSIGLELVSTLAGQLGGTLQYCCGETTCYGVVFPERRNRRGGTV
jgi:two-component sensor histidine kinase/CheY-like chemotaxis protein